MTVEDAVEKAKVSATDELRRLVRGKVRELRMRIAEEPHKDGDAGGETVPETQTEAGVKDAAVPMVVTQEIVYDRYRGMGYVLLVQDPAAAGRRQVRYRNFMELDAEVQRYEESKVAEGARQEGSSSSVSNSPLARRGGSVEVSSRPRGAGVWIGGKELGKTPATIASGVGRHQLVFKKSGFVDAVAIVDVTTNSPAHVEVKLIRETRCIDGDNEAAWAELNAAANARHDQDAGLAVVGIGQSQDMNIAIEKARTSALTEICVLWASVERVRETDVGAAFSNDTGVCVYDKEVVRRAFVEETVYNRKSETCFVLVALDSDDRKALRTHFRAAKARRQFEEDVRKYEEPKKLNGKK